MKTDSLILQEMTRKCGMTRNFKSLHQAPNRYAHRLASWSQVGTRCEAFRIAHRKCGRRSSSQWYSPTDTGRSKLYSHTQLWIVATLQHTTTHCNRLHHRTCRIRRHTDISYHMFPLGFLYCSVPRVMRDTTLSCEEEYDSRVNMSRSTHE